MIKIMMFFNLFNARQFKWRVFYYLYYVSFIMIQIIKFLRQIEKHLRQIIKLIISHFPVSVGSRLACARFFIYLSIIMKSDTCLFSSQNYLVSRSISSAENHFRALPCSFRMENAACNAHEVKP